MHQAGRSTRSHWNDLLAMQAEPAPPAEPAPAPEPAKPAADKPAAPKPPPKPAAEPKAEPDAKPKARLVGSVAVALVFADFVSLFAQLNN